MPQIDENDDEKKLIKEINTNEENQTKDYDTFAKNSTDADLKKA